MIDGRMVLGPQKEIQEVKNAYRAYEQLGRFDPYALSALLELHGVMTALTVEESGMFRTHNEGVFNGDVCVFMAPPPRMVPRLMDELFQWLREAKSSVHPLILSSVFHYEFVFIHPFSDGNGRMARLWQTALLSDWNPIFRYLPLESRIYACAQEYYDAIATCHTEGKADTFLRFMLTQIDQTLALALTQSAVPAPSEAVERLLSVMEYDVPYSAAQLMTLLHLRSRDSFRKVYLNPALQAGLLTMAYPDKPTSRHQTYRKA